MEIPTISAAGRVSPGKWRTPKLEIHIDVYAVNRDPGGQNMLEVCIPWLIKPIDKESHDRLRMG